MSGDTEELKAGDRVTYTEMVTVHIVRGDDVRIELDSGEEYWTTRDNLEK
ncbi:MULTISPECIES: hypothetical protein [Listeria]|nr:MULTISPECIES: hypothetical protein [Listeria]MBC2164645.1 hypothetical protein [Listeria booriae]